MIEYKTKEQKAKFYNSYKWRKLRKQALAIGNFECAWCAKEGKVTTQDRATLEVDHVCEIETHPDLALEITNVRVLCKHHHNVRHNRFDGKEKKSNKWTEDERW